MTANTSRMCWRSSAGKWLSKRVGNPDAEFPMLDAQAFPPARQLSAHGFRRRSAKDVPSRHRPLQIEHLKRVGAEIPFRGAEFREGEPVQRLARLLRQRHD